MYCQRCEVFKDYCVCGSGNRITVADEGVGISDDVQYVWPNAEETTSNDPGREVGVYMLSEGRTLQTSPLEDDHISWPMGHLASPQEGSNDAHIFDWNTYTPVNYQGPMTNEHFSDCYRDYGSPNSTIRASSDIISADPSLSHQSFEYLSIPEPDHVRTKSRDFIEMGPFIYLEGKQAAVEDLLVFVGDNLNRQFASSKDQLCALYALEISLRSMFPQESPTFQELVAIWDSPEYTAIATSQAQAVGMGNIQEDLFARGNLSVNVIHIILRILGTRMNHVFALGIICQLARVEATSSNGAPVHTYTVFRLLSAGNDPTPTTVWLHNDSEEETGTGISHWSGFGVDLQAQSGILAPRIVINDVEPVRTYQPPAEPLSTLPSSSSATGSTYSTADTTQSDSSRWSLVEFLHSGWSSRLSMSPDNSPQSYAMSRVPGVVPHLLPAPRKETMCNATFAAQPSLERASRIIKRSMTSKDTSINVDVVQNDSAILKIYIAITLCTQRSVSLLVLTMSASIPRRDLGDMIICSGI
ncbi:hypothetical protein FKW77_008511 [Venturia effusa]|uniref:Uncharacterized protein n=1 Tax=Venturia effusa TaxID=50376 RepID=A0A517L1S8_9PEZI|nr:hypothetical protein FKW77_008511 [Venturia effusa]